MNDKAAFSLPNSWLSFFFSIFCMLFKMSALCKMLSFFFFAFWHCSFRSQKKGLFSVNFTFFESFDYEGSGAVWKWSIRRKLCIEKNKIEASSFLLSFLNSHLAKPSKKKTPLLLVCLFCNNVHFRVNFTNKKSKHVKTRY